MLDDRVVRRPRDNHRSFNLELWNHWWNLVNWRLDVTLRWKVEDYQLGRAESVMWKAGTFKVVAPICVY
jgi:hypothetical protein